MAEIESDEMPEAHVSQLVREDREAEHYYPAPQWVLVRDGDGTHVWANGVHFVTDEGTTEPGQYLLSHEDWMGYFVSRIGAVSENEGEVTVRHLVHWNQGDIEYPENYEEWPLGRFNGEYEPEMGDTLLGVSHSG